MTKLECAAPSRRRILSASAACLVASLCAHAESASDARQESEPAGDGPPEDRRAVIAVLHEYLRVFDEQRESSISAAFHPAALLMSATRTGELKAMTLTEWWTRISRPRSTPLRRVSAIRQVDVVGAAAVARIDIVTGDARSTDYLMLLRLADGWRIVSKTLSSTLA
jgi:hypothetical protein